MDYEIKIKINNLYDGVEYEYGDEIKHIDDELRRVLNEIMDEMNFDYSITCKEVKPIIKQQKVIDKDYIDLAQYLNKKNNEKYNNNKIWDENKIFLSADQFRLLINNDKIQYNNHELTISDCYYLIDFALQKDQLYVIQSGASFRKKIESIIANKINHSNKLSNNKKGFMFNKQSNSDNLNNFITENILNRESIVNIERIKDDYNKYE